MNDAIIGLIEIVLICFTAWVLLKVWRDIE